MMLRLATGLLMLALPAAALAEPKQPAKAVAKPPHALPLGGQAKRNPCAAYGPGFVAVDGTATCMRIGGSISVGVGTSR